MAQENGWKECRTLGTKEKRFCWKLDDGYTIYIRRQFENAVHEDKKQLASDKVSAIHGYVRDKLSNSGDSEGGTDLANNVEKLRSGTEKEGLGKFMYELFGESVPYGQVASHIAALFVESGTWTKNKAVRGIKLKANAVDWKPCLRAYYTGSVNCDESK